MKPFLTDIPSRVLAHDIRAIARLITLIEAGNNEASTIASHLQRPAHLKRQKAHIIGITGAPGAGKSTLVDQLAHQFRSQGNSVAILAVDPSSPFTGGAILGDRIRMNRACEHPDIFIRSMATRGSLGGLSRATLEASHILDCAGFDTILIETVGVGQAEVDIVRTADTCLVVLVPGMGDSVQIIKAGLIEIADLFIINKADRDGTLILEKDLLTLLSLSEYSTASWKPSIHKTVATTGEGVQSVVTAATRHSEWLSTSSEGLERRLATISQMLRHLAGERIANQALQNSASEINRLAQCCISRQISPIQAVEQLINSLKA